MILEEFTFARILTGGALITILNTVVMPLCFAHSSQRDMLLG
jgi:hypothetical protein